MANYKPRTFLSDEMLSADDVVAAAPNRIAMDKPPRISPPAPTYASPAEVPLPLIETIKQAYSSGLTVAHIALVFELPDEWIEMFVRGGRPTH